MNETPKEMLANDAPKCANCRWMRGLVPYSKQPGFYTPSVDYGERVSGKGACMEPSVAVGFPALFYVQDLGLCSAWQKRGT
jgi:hypothetical protein